VADVPEVQAVGVVRSATRDSKLSCNGEYRVRRT
jgi:hypothetical protein